MPGLQSRQCKDSDVTSISETTEGILPVELINQCTKDQGQDQSKNQNQQQQEASPKKPAASSTSVPPRDNDDDQAAPSGGNGDVNNNINNGGNSGGEQENNQVETESFNFKVRKGPDQANHLYVALRAMFTTLQ